jgi:hypothetical protein
LVFAAGLSMVVTGWLPMWWGIVSIVIGVAIMTPVGFFGVLAALLWIIVMSIWLTVRGAPAAPARAAAP